MPEAITASTPARVVEAPSAASAGSFPDVFADIDQTIKEPPKLPSSRPSRATKLAEDKKPADIAPATVPPPVKEEPPIPPPPKPEPTKPPPPTPPPTDPKTAPPADKAPAPATEPPPEADPTQKFHLAPDLRRELRRVNGVLLEREAELTKLKGLPGNHEKAIKEATERADSLQARVNEMETELRHANYTRSSEYKEKFERPYAEKLAEAVELVTQLPIELDGEAPRMGTETDFNNLMRLPIADAMRRAKELFGDLAPEVIAYRRQLESLARNASKEVDRYREEGRKKETEREAQATRDRETLDRAWNNATTDIVTRYPDLFGERKDDAEWNAALKNGYAEVDKANNQALPFQEKIIRHAAIRARAAAFGPTYKRMKALEARVKELETDLQEYEKSVPGEGSKSGSGEPEKPQTIEESVDQMIDEAVKNSNARRGAF